MNWKALPPLSALRAFAAYAEKRSVSSAGTALNVSHAAISQQIRNLENHLGRPLLDRSGRKAKLTAEGRLLADVLTRSFSEISRQTNAIMTTEATRPLHISTTPSFAANWLLPRLASFRSKHPDIDIMIDPNPALTDPAPDGIDVALRFGHGQWTGLVAELLVPTDMVVVASPELIGDLDVTCPEDLLTLPWLQELGTTEASGWFQRHGITAARTGGLVALPGNLLLEMARAGQGVAVTAAVWVQGDIDAGRLKLLSSDNRGTGYHIVTRPGAPRPALRQFTHWLRRSAQS